MKIFNKTIVFISALCIGFIANARYFEDEYFTYWIHDNETVTITKYTNYWKELSGEFSINLPSEATYEGKRYTVSSISYFAFAHLDGLISLTIPNSVLEIGEEAFVACHNMKSLKIGNSVELISASAFNNCSNLDSVVIPNSVIKIENNAFSDCYSLKSLIIGNSVRLIERHAFGCCESLTSVDIPNSVKEIEPSVFSLCKELKTITIGNSVETMGKEVFFKCNKITDIYCKSMIPPTAPQNIFHNDIYKTATLYVPEGCRNVYKKDSTWGKFKKIEEKDFAGIGNIIAEEDVPNVSVDGNSIIVNGIEQDIEITVYEMSGRVIYQGRNHVIDGLERGIYIIQAGGKTFKVMI